MSKQKDELERLKMKLELDQILDLERKNNRELFAIKLVERIVFALVTTLLLGVIVAILNSILRNNGN